MGRDEVYRRNAEEAEQKARDAKFVGEREAYEKIALGWRASISKNGNAPKQPDEQ